MGIYFDFSLFLYELATIFVWLGFGCMSAGWKFAFEQRPPFERWVEFPDHRQRLLDTAKDLAICYICLGPISCIYAIVYRRYSYGWLWPWSKKALLEAEETTTNNILNLPDSEPVLKPRKKDEYKKLHELKVFTYTPAKCVLRNEEDQSNWRGAVVNGQAKWVEQKG